VPFAQRLTAVVAEDEVVVGHPMADGQQPLGLVGTVGTQQIDGRVGGRDRALALGGLRVAQPPAPVHPHQCFGPTEFVEPWPPDAASRGMRALDRDE
jgi:hypothetical protein